MNSQSILQVSPLSGFPWETPDPFLFCVHHLDAYPQGNDQMGPAASLAGREIGMDFEGKDGWRMYHGSVVPGFPRHPHRGFETVTVARQGLIDHSDSLGAAARFGRGDVQWVTAGSGIVHSEMFPLLNQDAPNPVELFQIWLNLPARDKMAAPHFKMIWNHEIPRVAQPDDQGGTTEVTLIAGELGGIRPPAPTPDSWAAKPENEVAIWTIRMEPHARWRLPAASAGINRNLYFFQGDRLTLDQQEIPVGHMIRLKSDEPVDMVNGNQESDFLMLQGRPIGEPIAQHGPFVMNSREEIIQAFNDYQRTEFGGWPWPSDGPVHGATQGRHARHPDGRVETAD